MLRAVLLALVAALITAPQAASAEPVTIKPSSPWNLDYGEARCRLARVFGEGDDQTALLLEQHAPKQTLEWVLAGSALEDIRRSRKLTVQFGPGQPPVERRLSGDTFAKWEKAIRGESLTDGEAPDGNEEDADEEETSFPVGLAKLDPAEGSQIEHLRLVQGDRDIILELGSMGPAYQAMNTCMANLVEYWGADLEREEQRAHQPVWKNAPMVARQIQQHYPSGALNRGAQADLHVRIMIDAEGAPTDCKITNLTVAEQFDDKACQEIMQRGEFEPALDLAGEPMPSFYVTRVLYRIG